MPDICGHCRLAPREEPANRNSTKCDLCRRFDSLVNNARRPRSRMRNPDVHLERADFVAWALATPRICYSCSVPERLLYHLDLPTQVGNRLSRLGVDRLRNGGDYEISNIAWCCFICNRAKSSTFSAEEMRIGLGPAIGIIWRQRLTAAGVSDHWITA